MATFSTNQTRQFYVCKNYVESGKPLDVGGLLFNGDGISGPAKNIWIEYMGFGGLTRSDIIPVKNIISITSTSAETMRRKLNGYRVSLSPDCNNGEPIVGQDYILRIAFRNYIGLSDEDQYFKYGMVHTSSSTTVSSFYKTLAKSLIKNFSREASKAVWFGLTKPALTEGDPDGIIPLIKDETSFAFLSDAEIDAIDGDFTGIVVIENPNPEWELGVMQEEPVNFTLIPSTVTDNGDEVVWGVVSPYGDEDFIVPNGRTVADLEYFCMGERGDQYRLIGFPHVIRTKYMIDPTKEYDLVNIHYYYDGSNEGVQKSEKDITIAILPLDNQNNYLVRKITALCVAPD